MIENMPILYQNIMLGMPTELERDAFLFATNRPGNDRMCYRAERFAREVGKIAQTLTPILDRAAQRHGAARHDDDLMQYILRRHANNEFGGNLTPTYCPAQPVGSAREGRADG